MEIRSTYYKERKWDDFHYYTGKVLPELRIVQPSVWHESRGTISIAWRGPEYTNRAEWTHLSLIWDYLTDSAASPLQLAFVENDDPVCADVGPAHDIFTEGKSLKVLIVLSLCSKLNNTFRSRISSTLVPRS